MGQKLFPWGQTDSKHQKAYAEKIEAINAKQQKAYVNAKQQKAYEEEIEAINAKQRKTYAENKWKNKKEAKAEKKEKRKASKARKTARKVLDSKGLIVDEEYCLLTPTFARIEAKTGSDGKLHDSNGHHYLKEMDYQCHFCHMHLVLNRRHKGELSTQTHQQAGTWYILVLFAVIKAKWREYLTTLPTQFRNVLHVWWSSSSHFL